MYTAYQFEFEFTNPFLNRDLNVSV